MKVKFKNGSIKLTAEGKADSEALYRFLTGGKQSLSWFQRRIGNEILMVDKEQQESLNQTVTITNEKVAYELFSKQDINYKFSDIIT